MQAEEAGEEIDEQGHRPDQEDNDDSDLEACRGAAHLALEQAAPPDRGEIVALLFPVMGHTAAGYPEGSQGELEPFHSRRRMRGQRFVRQRDSGFGKVLGRTASLVVWNRLVRP